MTETETNLLGLGISIYLSQPEQANLQMLRSCPARGVGAVFTSLHIPEDDNATDQPRLLATLAATAHELGLALFADISPLTLRRLARPGSDPVTAIRALRDWGLRGVRFDDGFPVEVAAAVSRAMDVQLNASTLTSDEVVRLQAAGADLANIQALHNFYPRPDTGLSRTAFGRANERLHQAGISVGAFVAGDGVLRGPVHAGLPTCEDHRFADPATAALDLWRGPWPGAGADVVYVGDIDLAVGTWARWPWVAQGAAPLRWARHPAAAAGPEGQVAGMISGRLVSNRVDESDRVIRLRTFRPMIGEPSALTQAGVGLGPDSPTAGLPRPSGSVTVDNSAFGRYAGEVQVTRVDLPPDPRVCLLGRVIDVDIPALAGIPGDGRLVLLPHRELGAHA